MKISEYYQIKNIENKVYISFINLIFAVEFQSTVHLNSN